MEEEAPEMDYVVVGTTIDHHDDFTIIRDATNGREVGFEFPVIPYDFRGGKVAHFRFIEERADVLYDDTEMRDCDSLGVTTNELDYLLHLFRNVHAKRAIPVDYYNAIKIFLADGYVPDRCRLPLWWPENSGYFSRPAEEIMVRIMNQIGNLRSTYREKYLVVHQPPVGTNSDAKAVEYRLKGYGVLDLESDNLVDQIELIP